MLNEIMVWATLFVGSVRRKFSGKDEMGASIVEYALLLALIAVVAIGALVFLGHTVNNTLGQVQQQINSTYSPTTS
jgi:pilus assembly protein Flp/PilA